MNRSLVNSGRRSPQTWGMTAWSRTTRALTSASCWNACAGIESKFPNLQYTCTRAIARSTWPDRHRYGLKPLADWLGVRFQHHDALEDSIACAKVLLAAGIDKQASSLEDLEVKLRLRRGSAGTWGHRGPAQFTSACSCHRRDSARPRPDQHRQLPLPRRMSVAEPRSRYDSESRVGPDLDLQRLLMRADFIRPLSGKCVVFAGKLKAFSCEDAHCWRPARVATVNRRRSADPFLGRR